MTNNYSLSIYTPNSNNKTLYPSTAPCSPSNNHSSPLLPTVLLQPQTPTTTRKRRTSSLSRFVPDINKDNQSSSNDPVVACQPLPSSPTSSLIHDTTLPYHQPASHYTSPQHLISLPILPTTFPPTSSDTPPLFRRSRARSSLPRPSSLLPKLDHLPIELLYVIAEYVSTPTRRERDNPTLAPRVHVRLAKLARSGKRLAEAVTPVLYKVPAIETVAQLRRLVLSIHVSSARVLRTTDAPCSVHPLTWPLFAYVRGMDIARLEDLARSHVAVNRLVTRFLTLIKARTFDYTISPTPVGVSVVDESLAVHSCTCFPAQRSCPPTPIEPTSPSPKSSSGSLRRSVSNSNLVQHSPIPDLAKVYKKDLDTNDHTLLIPKLVSLNISFVKCVSSSTLVSLLTTPHTFMRMTHLNLSGTQLTDPVLSTIVSNTAPTLERLALAWNPQLSDLTLASLASHACPNDQNLLLRLTHLDLTHCRDISDWGLARIAPKLPNIRAISLAWCGRVSARVVHAALSYWPHLKAISVMGCPRIGGSLAVHRMWSGYVLADVELRARVHPTEHLGTAVGLVKRVDQLLVNPENVVFYLDV